MAEKFRRQLRQEAEIWKSEGLISDQIYTQLSDRYQFDRLEAAASNRFIAVLVGLGAVLLGLGAIAFVAANWQGWPRSLKIGILLSSLILTHGIGFYLWRFTSDRWQHRFGQGLLLLGTLLLGANLGLMSQMFHLDGPIYQLYLIWGLGVTSLAISLRMTLLGFVSLVLMALAYGSSLDDWLSIGRLPGIARILQHAPLITGVVGIILARWWNSRVIFALMMIAFIPTVWIQLAAIGVWSVPTVVKLTLGLTLPPAFLWGYNDRAIEVAKGDRQLFQPLARRLALLLIALQLYLFSFHGWWNSWGGWGNIDDTLGGWELSLDIFALVGLTVWQWFQLAKSRRSGDLRRFDSSSFLVINLLTITSALFLWHSLIYPLPIFAPLIINIEIFLLAVNLIRIGLKQGTRLRFWSGLILLTSQIISRMLEYETGLLLKSIVFILCGLGVMAAGFWFEKKN
ncbi:MAG: DUF2157 domain-containing protein [Roseofilum sp. SBFL]|uniref:DUF2157 domain-containing protein n=1 Tax=unclassified Roseofilum TaxID=2620099 RepID=UPI001B2209C7|nr:MULTISPECIES: DUF2157 domain-containing protein [unclassified Roseofilum]MBP0015087.1 DUF2157 domain-containing protein [Roseofilum sp. SID3]MBP0024291.1 DUF2157 domain-containing protein [Roseofilum sp. SID2]MBP0036528.1 DUF2157 domain-containing protein [Roseofilum sp. SID1]MBP0041539.1 DUF2157 domain-containing protein [Roseofilum sp. SBFL]